MMKAVLPMIIFAVVMGLYGEYWARRERKERRSRHRQ